MLAPCLLISSSKAPSVVTVDCENEDLQVLQEEMKEEKEEAREGREGEEEKRKGGGMDGDNVNQRVGTRKPDVEEEGEGEVEQREEDGQGKKGEGGREERWSVGARDSETTGNSSETTDNSSGDSSATEGGYLSTTTDSGSSSLVRASNPYQPHRTSLQARSFYPNHCTPLFISSATSHHSSVQPLIPSSPSTSSSNPTPFSCATSSPPSFHSFPSCSSYSSQTSSPRRDTIPGQTPTLLVRSAASGRPFLSRCVGSARMTITVDAGSKEGEGRNAWQLLFDSKLMLLIPLLFYSGLQAAYISADYRSYVVQPLLGTLPSPSASLSTHMCHPSHPSHC
ncbi:unnamed protein product [Closterium sp. NIES-64]|nr:unnamed protein product [Closterium sp. NIES-64]